MKQKHPAKALYAFWNQVLEHHGNDVAFGWHGWGLTWSHDDQIGFGQLYSRTGTVYPHFYLDPKGRFQWAKMWGYYRRNAIVRHVPFLAYGHIHSRYQWTPNMGRDPVARRHYYGISLGDWQDPRHYVSEDLLGARGWSNPSLWCELVEVAEGDWRILPSRKQHEHIRNWSHAEAMKRFARYDDLVTQRYNRAERDYRIYHKMDMPEHLKLPREQRAPTIRVDGADLSMSEAVQRMAVLIEVGKPAKTTPLKRPKEARHGNDVVPAQPV